MLEDREADDLGLREVARAVGVSAASVYRHFPDKQALLMALAEEGLQQLGDAQRAAAADAGGGEAGFKATGRAYVAFALANPALFRVIFSRVEPEAASGAAEMDDEASRLLSEFATSMVDAGDTQTARLIATQAWALVHGLAVLILDKRLPNDPELIASVIDRGAPHRIKTRSSV